jgi:hypothetical protein
MLAETNLLKPFILNEKRALAVPLNVTLNPFEKGRSIT